MITSESRTKSPRSCAPAECCPDPSCESGLKNHFFEGKRLTPDMFRIEQRYMVERRRLLNRAIHGWGVVYGYGVSVAAAPRPKAASTRKLKVAAGLALDECGRELLQIGELELPFGDVILIDEKGRPIDRADATARALPAAYRPGHVPERLCWLLRAHYAERSLDHVTISDPCRCSRDEWDHLCETVRYSLQSVPCDACCQEPECELECGCGKGNCCGTSSGRQVDPAQARSTANRTRAMRGGCRCLCEHLTQLNPGGDCTGRLTTIEEPCGVVCVDLAHGVPLACLELVRDECKDVTFGADVEPCGPRRLVKRNDLLFDLIRGCDLTRISEFSWAAWHRKPRVPFDEFSQAFGTEVSPDEYLTDFWVRFSRPVRSDTVLLDAFVMTIVTAERDDPWWELLRVPIVRIDTSYVPRESDDPPGHVRGARLVVDRTWVHETIKGYSRVFDQASRVEIEIRGDFILDCNGQAVDANASGLSTLTGNGTPGGTFLSVFGVDERDPRSRQTTPIRDRKGVAS